MPRQDAYGAVVQSDAPDRDSLHGLTEIAAYSGFSESIIKRLAVEEGFPLAHIAARWISSRAMVDQWFRGQIEKAVKANLEGICPHLPHIVPHPAVTRKRA